MRDKRIYKMVVLALFSAIIFVMAYVPFLGFITVVPISITILIIPVILGAFLFDWKAGAFLGLVFGLCSWMAAYLRPSGPVEMVFQKIYIAVPPRVIFGVVAGVLLPPLRKGIKNDKISIPLAAFLSAALHTIVTVSFFFLLGQKDEFGNNLLQILKAVVSLNGILEAVVAAVVVPLLFFPLEGIVKRRLQNEI